MAILNILLLVAGLCVVAVTLYDVFMGVVVPRWTGNTLRLAPFVARLLWPPWKRAASRLGGRREAGFLAAFAPFMVFALMGLWVSLLIAGFAMALFSMRHQIEGDYSFGDSAYLAGVAFLTIGFGDVVALGAASRFFTLSAGVCGLVLASLVISLSFTLYGAFSKRESLILTLDARAGRPPSGVVLLETYAQFRLADDLPALFEKWESWAAEILESHLSYPLLPYFRSSHDSTSWIAALGAVLDAATLLTTAVAPSQRCDERPIGSAHLMYHMGCHVLGDFSKHLFGARSPHEGGAREPGVSREEFVQARRRLEEAGYKLREEEESWQSFAAHRAIYAWQIENLARAYATPKAQWIGGSSVISLAARSGTHPRAARQ